MPCVIVNRFSYGKSVRRSIGIQKQATGKNTWKVRFRIALQMIQKKRCICFGCLYHYRRFGVCSISRLILILITGQKAAMTMNALFVFKKKHWLIANLLGLEHNLDISSVAHEWPFVRRQISSLHATGGEPLTCVVHHPVHEPSGVPVFE